MEIRFENVLIQIVQVYQSNYAANIYKINKGSAVNSVTPWFHFAFVSDGSNLEEDFTKSITLYYSKSGVVKEMFDQNIDMTRELKIGYLFG